MVFKKSFTLLVATKTIPFFVVAPIISDRRCLRIYIMSISDPLKRYDNKYFQLLLDKKAFPLFSRTFTKFSFVFLENPSFGMLKILKIRKDLNLP